MVINKPKTGPKQAPKPAGKPAIKPPAKPAAPQGAVAAPPVKFEYLCPACTNVAIQTSNKMLGVTVNCQKCGKSIKLDNKNNYRPIKAK